MKATIEEVNKVQKRIKLELTETEVASAFQKSYASIQRESHIKGFRPGKAPLSIIKKFYGESAAADVADRLIKEHVFVALKEHNISAVSSPVLELETLPKDGAMYNISALVDVMPAVTIEGYKGLELSFSPIEVNDETVEKEIKMMQRRHGKQKELSAETVAAHGMMVSFDQQVVGEDGSPLPQASTENMSIELGEESGYLMLPEIEKALIGMKAGASKTIAATFPADYRDKDLAGKKASITLHAKKLQELILPALDDDFAKDAGVESLATLKNNIRKSYEKQADQMKRQQLEGDALRQLIEKNPFEVPPSLVDRTIDAMIDELNIPAAKKRTELKKDEAYRDRLKPTAKERVKNTLILSKVIEAEKFEVTDDEMTAYWDELFPTLPEGETSRVTFLKNLKKSYSETTRENLLFRKALDFVINNSQIKPLKG